MGERHPVLHNTGTAPKKQKAFHNPYPVYWVEAFNSAHQKWVPIDPLSTFTVNAPEKLEPPLSHLQNSLTYAIAFEEDYAAKDVTRRYAKAYNAKTRKFRVECTPEGDNWLGRTMKFFKRSITLDRDQVEDAVLGRKEAAEGIPKSVQDFKGHPVYVLERHLRHNEVIHPLNQVGKVNCGTAMNPKMEPIYRRKDVHIVRSADKWYRMGRDVRDGEQPLKHAKLKKGRQLSIGAAMEVDEQEDELGAGLYAEFQTETYTPPPVVLGRVPRNVYGNLDLYAPSMCPPGGTHIRHRLASKAARIVGIDCADAVTGFSFKGRHGTAVIQGIVVATEYAEAVQVVIDGMEYEQEAAELAARSSEALRLWRRFFLGLRIAQRVNAIVIDGERGPGLNVQDEISREDRALAEKDLAGGFFADEGNITEPPGQPQHHTGNFIQDFGHDHESGGFILAEKDEIEQFVPSLPREHSFESSILDSQHLRSRRLSSSANEAIYEEDDDFEFDADIDPKEGESIHDEASLGSATVAEQQVGGYDGTIETDFIQKDQVVSDVDEDKRAETDVNINTEEDRITSPPSSLPSSPSDNGSLLLEDPEDEDADPDWLVDAT